MDLRTRLSLMLAYDPNKVDWIAARIYDPAPVYNTELRCCEKCSTRLSGYNPKNECFHHDVYNFDANQQREQEEILSSERELQERIEQIIQSTCSHYGVSFSVVRSYENLIPPVRLLLAFLLHVDGEINSPGIGKLLNRDYSVINKWLKRIDLVLLFDDMIAIRSMYQNKNINEELRI